MLLQKKILLKILFLLASSNLFAEDTNFVDFGIRGHLYDIKEKSFKEEIETRLKEIDYSYWEKELIDSAKKSLIIESTKTNCMENKNYIHNPSFEITEDVVIPYLNKTLFKKGYIYNPLKENNIKFKTHQIFIFLFDVHQLMLAVKYSKQADIFVVKGDMQNIFDYGIEAYAFREKIEGKAFNINCLPTVFTQKDYTFVVNEYLLNDESENKEKSND